MKSISQCLMFALGIFWGTAGFSDPQAQAAEPTFLRMEGDWEVYSLDGIESAHTYAHKSTIWWEVAHYGARAIKLHFSKLDLADAGDTVTLFDGNQVLVEVYKGKNPEGFWTAEIAGDRALLYFVTNTYSTAWGFQVDQVSVLR